MSYRDQLISGSVLRAIFNNDASEQNGRKRPGLLTRLSAFFSLFDLGLVRHRPQWFAKLRSHVWLIDHDEYTESFRSPGRGRKNRMRLLPVGDLGYSGSKFFTTLDSRYLVKSLPRGFEQSFFRHRLLHPYVEHMELDPDSLLVRITDLLQCPSLTIGAAIGAAPSHHIVMENILHGKSTCSPPQQAQWETYDLKPTDYFFPERDIAGGNLVKQSVKDRLIDEFHDKIRVTVEQKEELVAQLVKDSKLLQESNAVDYSLFVVRYPARLGTADGDRIPPPPGRGSPWRHGIVSRDGSWVYRTIVLDFFWAKDSLQAHTFTALVTLFNSLKLGRDHGPMSITTTSNEYRQRFLRMVENMVEVTDSAGQPSGEIRHPAISPSDAV